MRGVGRPWLSYPLADLKTILVNDAEEAVSAYRIVAGKGFPVHVPELNPSYARVGLSDFPDIL